MIKLYSWVLAATGATPVSAQAYPYGRYDNYRRDSRWEDMRRDRQELSRDQAELARDREDLRRLYARGASPSAIERKRAEVRGDLREVRESQEEVRENYYDLGRYWYDRGQGWWGWSNGWWNRYR
jgi:hypothetical protein